MPSPVQRFGTLLMVLKTWGGALMLALILSLPASFAAQPASPPVTDQLRAQPPRPRIRLNTLKPVAGEDVVIVGSGLPVGSQVTARLTAPNGSVTREGTRVQDGGRFRLTLVLPDVGTYTLVVRGQGLDQTRVLEAQKPKQPQRDTPESEVPGRPPRTERPPPKSGNRPAQQPEPNTPASGPEK